ncbi:MAG: MFS transporter [Burkholderiaceae bacterium]
MHTFPFVPLFIGMAVQTLVTMAAYSVPAAAPAIAADLDIAGENAGLFIAIVYGMGMFSAVLSPSLIRRYGAVRVSQCILISAIAMIVMAATGDTVWALAAAGFLLGSGYGATAPTSSHLLMKRTAPQIRNLVFSIRQIGVPLGGVLGGLIVPPLVVAANWQTAIGVQLIPAVVVLIILQILRKTYDADRNPDFVLNRAGLLGPLKLLITLPAIRLPALAAFFYAGTQLCFVAFTSVHLTSRADFSLVAAGQMLAAYQLSGVISRPIWGVIADRICPARTMLGIMGFVMAAMAVCAGQFSSEWSFVAILLVVIVAGASASGYTGLAFAEFARIGGDSGAAEATGLGAFAQFVGVMLLPTGFSLLVSVSGYALAYNCIAGMASLAGAALLLLPENVRQTN